VVDLENVSASNLSADETAKEIFKRPRKSLPSKILKSQTFYKGSQEESKKPKISIRKKYQK